MPLAAPPRCDLVTKKMLEDGRAGRFEVLVAEALDRLSGDQENIAGLFKQLCFAGVRLVTLSEGEIGELHVGLRCLLLATGELFPSCSRSPNSATWAG